MYDLVGVPSYVAVYSKQKICKPKINLDYFGFASDLRWKFATRVADITLRDDLFNETEVGIWRNGCGSVVLMMYK